MQQNVYGEGLAAQSAATMPCAGPHFSCLHLLEHNAPRTRHKFESKSMNFKEYHYTLLTQHTSHIILPSSSHWRLAAALAPLAIVIKDARLQSQCSIDELATHTHSRRNYFTHTALQQKREKSVSALQESNHAVVNARIALPIPSSCP